MTWDNPVNRIVLGLKLLKEMEQEVAKIRHNLKETQDKQKIYGDKNRVHKEFSVGVNVYLGEGKEEFLEAWKLCQAVT